MPDIGCAAAAADMRRHIPAIQTGIASLENVILVSHAVLFAPSPYGILWVDVDRIMRELHHGQDELVLAVTHNLRLFEARFHVTAAAYEANDVAAAEAAMLEGAGVAEVAAIGPVRNLTEPVGWPEPVAQYRPPDDVAQWRRCLRLLRRAAVPLAGDSRALTEYGAAWRDIARGMERAAADYAAAVDSDLESWRGNGAASYQSMITANIQIIRDTAAIARQMAECVRECAWTAILTRKLYLLTIDACLAAFGEPGTTAVPIRSWINGCALTLADIATAVAEVRRNAYTESSE